MMIQAEEDEQGGHRNNGEIDQRYEKILSAIQGLCSDGGEDDDEGDLY